ncbi:MAG: hypothetical protein KF730_03355 [Sphingomonas sp.]|uniref:hypothetical protein n=1 Tax=Sphingomonas sp. TaxID=28214 RepID=UPI0025E9FAD8|nr:hypothetical protein [Sphingomonas sp.]MBX3563595.1 hypothetical protein [Sphingomonas sp.]
MSSIPSAPKARKRTRSPFASLLLALPLLTATPAAANNYGESASWQFETPSDLASQLAARDLIERRRAGVFSAPIYNTHVDRQYNCSVAATATGNSGVQSAVANSPTVTGASSTATGNNNSASTTGDRSSPDITNGQLNAGAVSSTLVGGTSANVQGTAWQALNSTQTNSGNQAASVQGSSACAFGVLN